jgi:hypothetical protein
VTLDRSIDWIGRAFTAPFRALYAAACAMFNMSADQLRAMMCWGMLGGIVALSFQNIWLVHLGYKSVAEKEWNFEGFLEWLLHPIQYNSALCALFAIGVVFIGVQAGTLKARLGDLVNLELGGHGNQVTATPVPKAPEVASDDMEPVEPEPEMKND